MKKIAIVLVALLAATGCTKEQTGGAVGGVLGGVLGANVGEGQGRTAAIIVGTMAGAAVGSQVGRYMDQQDRMRMRGALEENPTGQTTAWTNPDTGHHYEVTPQKTYYEEDRPCREYRSTAVIDGKAETIVGTACRRPNGDWVVQ